MTPTHTRRKGKLYRYYISTDVLKNGANDCPVRRIPAGEIEDAVLNQIRAMLQSPEIIVATWRAARQAIPDISERQVRDALQRFDELWAELFPAEQARIIQLLVQKVDIATSGAAITLRTGGLSGLIGQLSASTEKVRAA